MADVQTPVPTTIGELGIAFAARNKLEDERNQNSRDKLDDLSKKIDDDIKSKANQEYVDEIKKELDTLSNSAVTKAEFRIGLGVVTTILTIATTAIGLWKSLTGK